MPFIKSIASRIFGLAIILVCMTIALAGFLLYQVTALNGQLQTIAGYYAPLRQCLVHLNEAGLRRRLAFERWHGALDFKESYVQSFTGLSATTLPSSGYDTSKIEAVLDAIIGQCVEIAGAERTRAWNE